MTSVLDTDFSTYSAEFICYFIVQRWAIQGRAFLFFKHERVNFGENTDLTCRCLVVLYKGILTIGVGFFGVRKRSSCMIWAEDGLSFGSFSIIFDSSSVNSRLYPTGMSGF